jgi:transcriptional regulator of arginine metabolism
MPLSHIYATKDMRGQKRFRQGRILNLIKTENIANQDALRRRLAQIGLRVTQATLSRDLHELGVVKAAKGYRSLSSVPAEAALFPSLAHSVSEFLLEVRPVKNLLVLKTPPGGAQPLARAVDAENWKDVVGTIAGGDTILIITPSSRIRVMVQRRLEALLR